MKSPWPWVAVAAVAAVIAAYQSGRLAERSGSAEIQASEARAANPTSTSGSGTGAAGSPNSGPASPASQGSGAPISYSGRRSDSPFTTDQFEPKRSPWTVRLQVSPNEESQSPGAVETIRLAVIKDGREVESSILETGQELNASFFTKGPVVLRLECLRDWTLEIQP